MLEGIFYSEFDNELGPIIRVQGMKDQDFIDFPSFRVKS